MQFSDKITQKRNTFIKSAVYRTWHICAGTAAAAHFDELLNETRRKADAAVIAATAITVACGRKINRVWLRLSNNKLWKRKQQINKEVTNNQKRTQIPSGSNNK